MNHKHLEHQTISAFTEWRRDPSIALEMRLKDGSDEWEPCQLNDDCWWRHSYYRVVLRANVPARLLPSPKKVTTLLPVTTPKK